MGCQLWLTCFWAVNCLHCAYHSAVTYAAGSSDRHGGRWCSVNWLVYSERPRRVSGVSGVLSELEGRVRAGVGGRAVVVVILPVVARVISRRLVCIASVVICGYGCCHFVGRNFYDGQERTIGVCRDDGESACAAAIVGRPHHYRLVGLGGG